MKCYISGKNKWELIIESINKKTGKIQKHSISIPPTNKDRIDMIILDKLIKGYNYDIDPIIIIIKDGIIKQIITKHDL